MHLVSSTKAYIQQYRNDKWDDLLTNVKSFCEKRNIDVPDMNAHFVELAINKPTLQLSNIIEWIFFVPR
jgi:hypothetical protein